MEKLEPLCTVWNLNVAIAIENSMRIFQKIKTELPYDSVIPPAYTHPQKLKLGSQWGYLYTHVGCHDWLNWHGFGRTPEVGDGQGGLAYCGSWGCKESDTTEQLNWTELFMAGLFTKKFEYKFWCWNSIIALFFSVLLFLSHFYVYVTLHSEALLLLWTVSIMPRAYQETTMDSCKYISSTLDLAVFAPSHLGLSRWC